MKFPPQNLRIPGPTPCPPEVLEAVSNSMINHRGPEFGELILRVTENLKRVFMTENRLYILTASGTGALEAAVVNTLSPADKALAVSVGSFGDRFTAVAEAYGVQVTKLGFEWGTAADPESIRRALSADSEIKAVLVTHNETSTGVTNDLESIAKVVKGEFGKLLLIDAVSSIGCLPLATDQWRCDVVATASQKGLMVPPGLAFISVSEEAWKAMESAKMPRFYFDLAAAQRYLERAQNPWTPAVSLLYGLDVALDMILQEGLENVFSRHVRLADVTRRGLKELGLELAADEKYASDGVTAVKVPDGIDFKELTSILRTEFSIVVAGGHGAWQGKVFRIGHMGRVSEQDIREVLEALEQVLPRLGFHAAPTRV